MTMKDIKDTLIKQKAKLDARGVARVFHRNPVGKHRVYDAGYFYGYYDAILNVLEAIEKGEQNGEVNQSNVDSKI